VAVWSSAMFHRSPDGRSGPSVSNHRGITIVWLSDGAWRHRPNQFRVDRTAIWERDVSKTKKVISRDPERTRKKLLDAATVEFAAHGLNGAKVERIARRAGCNKRLVYHYFKGKEPLYLEVLEHTYSQIHRREDAINLDTKNPEKALGDLIDRLFERIVTLPYSNALIADENLHEARHIKKAKWVRDLHSRLIGQIEAMLSTGRDAGVFRADVDPVHLFVSILGLCLTYWNNRYTLSVVFSRDLSAKAETELWKKHVLELCLQGLRPQATRSA